MPVSPHSGFPFPMIHKSSHGRVDYVHNNSQTLITSSVRQILLTTPGERMWNPAFGCRIQLLQFNTYSETMSATIKNLVLEALVRWEPRITVKAADITVSATSEIGKTVQIVVKYVVKNPDSTMNPTTSIAISI